MGKLQIAVLTVLAAATAATVSAQSPGRQPLGVEAGFFRPAPDPALTSFNPPPASREAQQPGSSFLQPAPPQFAPPQNNVPAANPPAAPAAQDPADAIRRAEEAKMDRAEREHRRARADAAMKAAGPPPAVSSGAPAEPSS